MQREILEEKLAQASELHRAKNLPAAVSLYEEVLAEAPAFSYGHYMVALALLDMGRLEDAKMHLGQSVAKGLTDFETAKNCGELLERLNDLKMALAAYQQATRMNPTDDEVRERIRHLYPRYEFFSTYSLGRQFVGDRMATLDKSTDFLNDDRFVRSFLGNCESDEEEGRAWRLHTLTWAAIHALQLEGDFVECGVFTGFMSNTVIDYVDFAKSSKKFYLYDTFEGFAPKYTTADDFGNPRFFEAAQVIYARPGLYDFVTQRFSRYPNAKVIRGIIPDILHEIAPEKVAYLHLDLNAWQPEVAALEFFFDRVVPSGVIVFDDYGWMNYHRLLEAHNAFCAARGYKIMELPTGQGLLIKR